MFGEAIRSLGRLEYDYYNNGYGNAYDYTEDDVNYYGDDDQPPNGSWSPKEYYADMGRHLLKFLRGNKADAGVVKAASFVAPSTGGAKPWDHRPDPQFKNSITILKNWFVENESTLV